jgi:hypothetical protein
MSDIQLLQGLLRTAAESCHPVPVQVRHSEADSASDGAAAQLGSMTVDDAAEAGQAPEQQPVENSAGSAAGAEDADRQELPQVEPSAPHAGKQAQWCVSSLAPESSVVFWSGVGTA